MARSWAPVSCLVAVLDSEAIKVAPENARAGGHSDRMSIPGKIILRERGNKSFVLSSRIAFSVR
jgi:hypothetical protein